VRRGRPGQRGGGRGSGAGRGRGGGRAPQENVEKPRTDDNATTPEGREVPPVEPQVEETPATKEPETEAES
jgi:hypothetical protein